MTLTRSQIEQMPAGREMDALVAEHVMGWKWRRSNVTGCRCIYPEGCYPEWMDKPADMTEPLVADWEHGRFLLSWSKRIEYAWGVIEKLDADGWWPSVDSVAPGDCRVDFYNHHRAARGEISGWDNVSAETAPLAICRAALLTQLKPKEGK